MNRPAALLRINALMAAHDAEKAQLQAMISKLELRVAELEEQLRLERARKYGPSSEKRKDRIFNEAEQEAAEDESDEEEETSSRVPDTGRPEGTRPPRKKRGRKPLPADLPRQRVEYDLTDEEKICPCCREQMHRMGESKTEQLQVEVKAVVLENVRFKYACRNCERTGTSTPVVLASMPPQPLPGSVATASTLAWVLASKFVDGMPLYRLSTALNRVHVDLSRGTLGHWVVQSSERHFERVYDVLHDRLRGQDVIHGDETRVQVLKEEGRDAQSESFMWAYRSIEGSPEPIVLLDYQPGRGMIHPQTFLGDFSGTLMTDGYEPWRKGLPSARHLGCMAHARRKFADALKAHKKGGGLPAEALEYFGALYDVERLAREGPPEGMSRDDYVLKLRQEHSVPVLDAFKEWLEEVAPKVLPSSTLGNAISYTLNQWDHLAAYADDPRAPIDNNLLERDIRKFVIGRRSWLFNDTVQGARASAVIYSLALTCRACAVDPFEWFAHALTELPCRGPDADIDDLLPWNFDAKDKAASAISR